MAIETTLQRTSDIELQKQTSAARRRRAERRQTFKALGWHVGLALAAFFLLLPLLFMVSTSLKTSTKALAYPIEWLPNPVVWRNYIDSMIQPGLPFGIFAKNTTYVTVLIMIGDVLTCSMAAFAFARLRFPNRDKLFILVISTMMLPDVATMVPTFLLFNEIGWVDTLQPLWVRHWFAGSAFTIFLFRQFFRTIPYELDEAARIDGAGTWRIWLQIVMPISQPVIATIAIFSFIAGWTDFLDPVIYINSMSKRTLALGLHAYVGTYASSWHFLMAATTITTLPIVFIFLVFQRFFVRGISTTGIAGR